MALNQDRLKIHLSLFENDDRNRTWCWTRRSYGSKWKKRKAVSRDVFRKLPRQVQCLKCLFTGCFNSATPDDITSVEIFSQSLYRMFNVD